MISALLGVLIGIFIGYQAFTTRRVLSQIYSSIKPKKEAVPGVADSGSPVAKRIQSEARPSAVIIPKSPQLLEFEENEELRRMNPGS